MGLRPGRRGPGGGGGGHEAEDIKTRDNQVKTAMIVLCRTSTTVNTPSYGRQNSRHVGCGPLNERRRRKIVGAGWVSLKQIDVHISIAVSVYKEAVRERGRGLARERVYKKEWKIWSTYLSAIPSTSLKSVVSNDDVLVRTAWRKKIDDVKN